MLSRRGVGYAKQIRKIPGAYSGVTMDSYGLAILPTRNRSYATGMVHLQVVRIMASAAVCGRKCFAIRLVYQNPGQATLIQLDGETRGHLWA
jgi:hypothetical protein